MTCGKPRGLDLDLPYLTYATPCLYWFLFANSSRKRVCLCLAGIRFHTDFSAGKKSSRKWKPQRRCAQKLAFKNITVSRGLPRSYDHIWSWSYSFWEDPYHHAGSSRVVYSFGLFPLLDHGEVDELALLPVLAALLAVLGGQFNSIFWPEKWPQYRPKNWPKMTFEKDISTNYQNRTENRPEL